MSITLFAFILFYIFACAMLCLSGEIRMLKIRFYTVIISLCLSTAEWRAPHFPFQFLLISNNFHDVLSYISELLQYILYLHVHIYE